jgi:hypothetical protein
MNTTKVFAKMLKVHSKGECVSLVTDYENAKDIAKLIISMPNTYIEDFQLSREDYDGYCDPWLLSYGEEGDVCCQKAVLNNGHIARGGGLYFIDTVAIGSYLPEDFVLDGEAKIKLIGGD